MKWSSKRREPEVIVMSRVKDALFKASTRLHVAVFFRSRGRVFGRAMGMPVVGLVTTGRRSGQRRATTLAAPIIEDGRVVLVASFGGRQEPCVVPQPARRSAGPGHAARRDALHGGAHRRRG